MEGIKVIMPNIFILAKVKEMRGISRLLNVKMCSIMTNTPLHTLRLLFIMYSCCCKSVGLVS